VFVLVTWDPGDASFVHVWDWSLRKNIQLPNWRREYSRGLSWHAAKQIQEFVRLKNIAFHTDAERHAARAAHDRSLREEHPDLPFGQARKNAAELSKPRLIDGEYANLVTEPVSEIEKSVVDVPQTLPACERTDDRIPDRPGSPAVVPRRPPRFMWQYSQKHPPRFFRAQKSAKKSRRNSSVISVGSETESFLKRNRVVLKAGIESFSKCPHTNCGATLKATRLSL
jgi:hypothetical protein